MTYSVLIVEDERPVSQVLEIKLSRSGISVFTAYDGKDAFQKIQNQSFDLVLLDLMMPEMDGFSVLREMRERGILVPVIVTTNLSQDEDRQKAKDLGASDYIVKSDTPLATIVQKVLERFQS